MRNFIKKALLHPVTWLVLILLFGLLVRFEVLQAAPPMVIGTVLIVILFILSHIEGKHEKGDKKIQ